MTEITQTLFNLQNYNAAIQALEDNRKRLFEITRGAWEIWWNGYDTPADACPTWAVWDNPIDDDGIAVLSAGAGFQLNMPAKGFMTINRNLEDKYKGSVISRRDEFLRTADGLTFDVGVQIHQPTQVGGFMIYYRRYDGYCFGIYLAPDFIGAGGYSQHRGTGFRPGTTAKFDTTSKQNIYRMVVPPNGSRTFKVFANGKFICQAEGNTNRVTSVRADEKAPYIIVGGEKGTKMPTGSNFTLKFARYRRGAFEPTDQMPPAQTRTPPPLPKPVPPDQKETFTYWGMTTLDKDLFWYPRQNPLPDLTATYEFKSARPGYRTLVLAPLYRVFNKGHLTIEYRLKIDPASNWRGLSSYTRDWMGTMGIIWSPDRVELTVGVKNVGFYKDIPIGIRRSYLNTTNDYHTYRIVRPANSYYYYLYIDGNPIPVLYDQHMDASEGGWLGNEPPSLLFGDTLNNWGKANASVAWIRWSPTSFAPALPT